MDETKEESSDDWEHIPRDVLLLVAPLLSNREARSLRLLNRHWMLSMDSVVFDLCVSYRSRMMMGSFTRVIELVSKKFINLRSLKVQGRGSFSLTENLAQLPSLTLLDLRNTGVGDDDVKKIRGLTRLQNLDLSWTKVKDEGVEHLAFMSGLTSLNLGWTKVTEGGIIHLSRLTGLKRLNLQHTAVGKDFAAGLRIENLIM